MTKTPRWITSATAAAQTCTIKLPWERGLRRQAFIASRKAADTMVAAPARSVRPAA